MLQKYVGNQNSTAFSRISDTMLTPGGQALMSKYRAAGGLGFLKGQTKTEINKSLRQLSTIMTMGGGAPDNASSLSRLRLQAATDGILSGGKGKGAHAAAALKGTIEGDVALNKARETAEEGMLNGRDNELAREGVANMGVNKKGLQVARKYGVNGINGSTPEQAIDGVSMALTVLVNSLKQMVAAPANAGRPKQTSAQ